MRVSDHGTPDRPFTGTPSDAEVAELRRKLAFYEGFDQILNESTARSAELVRMAAQRQEASEASARAANEATARLVHEQRTLLGDLASELAEVQERLEVLAARVHAAIAEVAGVELPSPPQAPPNGQKPAATSPTPPGMADAEASLFTLVVRGEENVERAQSLQEWLASLPGVTRVEPREFHHGVLRVEVIGDRPVTLEDLLVWGGPGLEVVDRGPQALIVANRGGR